MEEITAAETKQADDDETNPDIPPKALPEGEVARSLVCEDCGKKFAGVSQAEFHGSKTGHENFAESTEDFVPLTEEEKKAKLEGLKAALAEKRARQALVDKEEKKKNEVCRPSSILRLVSMLIVLAANPNEVHQGSTRHQGGAREEGAD